MLFMILFGLAWAPAHLTDTPSQDGAVIRPFSADGPRKDCPNPSPQLAEERERGARARRLDELPPGRLEYAVFRSVDGCAIPAVVHQSLPGTPERENRGDR